MKYIYVITGIQFGYMYGDKKRHKDGTYHSYRIRTSPTQDKRFTIRDQRTWGWYSTLKGAKEALKLYSGAILENSCYTSVVIEKFSEGLCTMPREWWYKWEGTEEEGKYVPGEKPKEFKHICCFGMG